MTSAAARSVAEAPAAAQILLQSDSRSRARVALPAAVASYCFPAEETSLLAVSVHLGGAAPSALVAGRSRSSAHSTPTRNRLATAIRFSEVCLVCLPLRRRSALRCCRHAPRAAANVARRESCCRSSCRPPSRWPLSRWCLSRWHLSRWRSDLCHLREGLVGLSCRRIVNVPLVPGRACGLDYRCCDPMLGCGACRRDSRRPSSGTLGSEARAARLPAHGSA